jgi:hypothetical protein
LAQELAFLLFGLYLPVLAFSLAQWLAALLVDPLAQVLAS